MKLHRIYAILLRFFFLFKHSFDRISDVFYWPMIDLLLFGLMSSYFKGLAPELSNALLVVLSGTIFWIITWRGQHEINISFLEDMWNDNMINIFGSPLTFNEHIISFLSMGFIKAIISFSFASVLGKMLFDISILTYGWYLPVFFMILIISGWSIGFVISSIILRFGTKVQTLAWGMTMLIAPFSAITYPVSILPKWAQFVSSLIPTSYVFESIRSIISEGTTDSAKIATAFILSIIYLFLTYLLLRGSFKKVLTKGLVKLF